MPATCKETEKGTGVCTLEDHSCPPDQTVITSFAQCHYEAPALEKCPGELAISDFKINSGGVETIDDAGETIYVPYEMKVSIDPLTACKMDVSSEDLTGAWDMNEWQEDVTIFITQVKNSDSLQPEDFVGMTHLYSKETFLYNNVDGKDGDATGRVAVTSTDNSVLWMLNKNKDEMRSLKIEYGSAIQTTVAFAALAFSATLTYMF